MSNFGPGLINASSRPIDVMFHYLAVRETFRNRGPQIDRFFRFVGLPVGKLDDDEEGWAWCCCLVVVCLHESGRTWAKKTASVKSFWEAHADRRIAKPVPGCIGVHLRPDGKGHIVFMVSENPDGKWQTISGNTNAAGSREGDRVGLKDQDLSYFVGFMSVD